MFNAKVYKIAVLSFSGMMEEIYAAREVVRKWNQDNAERKGKLYLLVDGAATVYVLVGIVGNRIENKDLVDECLNVGKKVLLFFNSYQDPKNTIASEQTAVTNYMRNMQQRRYCAEFNGAAQLSQLINEQLEAI